MISKEENMALVAIFNTDFVKQVLDAIMAQVNYPHRTHVGSVDSWPTQLFTGQYAAMIFNTHYENEPGEHWVAIFIDGSTKEGFFFDSLPVRPFPQNLLYNLGKLCTRVYEVNHQRHLLQGLNLCGLYCLAFVEHFSKEQPFILCANNRLLNDINVVNSMLPYLML